MRRFTFYIFLSCAYALFLAIYAFTSSHRELTGGGSAMLVGLIVEALLFGLFTVRLRQLRCSCNHCHARSMPIGTALASL
eukprot:SAG31_NODE_44213_length_263_cov_1.579268_1_plen_79_part_01